MSGTQAGNRKVAAQVKKRFGVDKQGRSRFHAKIGSIGGENSHDGYFKRLKLEDPEKLAEISRRGRAKRTQNEGKNEESIAQS